MARTGKAAVFRGPGKPFELRELAAPRARAGRRPGPRVAREHLRLGSPLLARRRAARAPARRLDLRPRDDRARGGARGRRHDRLARAAAPRGRPRGLLLLLPVRPLLRVPPRPAGCVPPQDRPRDGAGRVPALGRRVRGVLLRPARGLRLPRARRSARRARLPGELRPLPGALRAHAGRPRVRRERGHPGRRRPRHPGGGGGAGDGRRHGDRDRPARRAARARPRLRGRPHAPPRGGAGPPRPRQAGPRLDGRPRRRPRVRLRRLPAGGAGGRRDAALRRAVPRDRLHQPGAHGRVRPVRRSSGDRRPSSASSCTIRG